MLTASPSIFSGDLSGNLWKFDVSNASTINWVVSNGSAASPVPLFQTVDGPSLPSHYASISNRQPITAAPTSQPAAYPIANQGNFIFFGTGKYLELDDNSSINSPSSASATPFTTQSFYGLWDKNNGSVISGRSELMQQKILGTSNGTLAQKLGTTLDNPATTLDESGFRVTTSYEPNYGPSASRLNACPGENVQVLADGSLCLPKDEIGNTPLQRGWFMDFPYSGDFGSPLTVGTGERSVFRPIISTGKLVFTSLVPSSLACEAGGTSFLMDLDPQTGGRLALTPFDLNGDLNFSSADQVNDPGGRGVVVSGKASTIGLVPTPTVIQMTPAAAGVAGKEVKVLSGSTGQLISLLERGGSLTLPGASGRRVTWRELEN